MNMGRNLLDLHADHHFDGQRRSWRRFNESTVQRVHLRPPQRPDLQAGHDLLRRHHPDRLIRIRIGDSIGSLLYP